MKELLSKEFLPATVDEVRRRGWDYVDIVLVTGDAYIDHPSFGVALIGRWLEAHGYRVAILAQPRHHDSSDFKRFGKPRLFFGITAGNLDSIVSNYTGNGRVRERDVYSPGGNPYFGKTRDRKNRRRPDRATIRYSQLAREAYGDVKIVLGGIEASLRRFVHYDYQQEKLRSSVLVDSKADVLVYGMGERAMIEIARRIESGQALDGIPSTCVRLTDEQIKAYRAGEDIEVLPSWDEITSDISLFLDAELKIDKHARALSSKPLAQRQKTLWVLQNRPAEPLSSSELDQVYSLPFTRKPHPTAGDVPAYRMIRHSITVVRGCFGNCSFCAIARHQGPIITSRSMASVVEEAKRIVMMDDFRGTISDLGGPTANLYGVSCKMGKKCKKHDCLYPKVCPNLKKEENRFLDLLREVRGLQKVKHVFISSGLRMDLLLQTPKLLSEIIRHHTPGALKIAPEHTEKEVLRLMHKPGVEVLEEFLRLARKLSSEMGKKIYFTPYVISAHPGCGLSHMRSLVRKLRRLGLKVRQFQDFTPTPGTISTAMYVTGMDRDSRSRIFVAKKRSERKAQRNLVETIQN